jgi:Polyketide cyclase / dehydrase and lipid transport
MTTIIVIIAVLLVALAALFVFAAMQPDTFRVERRTSIKAAPETIFPLINDFRNWTSWSPYEKIDPALKRTYAGAPSGKGAVYEWEGNSKVGKGRMKILDAPPPSKVVIKLDFLKPFEAHNTAEFTLAPKGDATEVAWTMHGPNLFVGKVMGILRQYGPHDRQGFRNRPREP